MLSGQTVVKSGEMRLRKKAAIRYSEKCIPFKLVVLCTGWAKFEGQGLLCQNKKRDLNSKPRAANVMYSFFNKNISTCFQLKVN